MQLPKIIAILTLSLTVLAGCAPGRTAFTKGQNLETAGDLDQAVIKYAEASTANPEMGEYRLRFLKACAEAARLHTVKGDNLVAVKNYGDALREYQTAFTLDPSLERAKQQAGKVNKIVSSQAFYKEGEEFEKTRKTREALRSYKKAWELDQTNTEAKDGIDRISKNSRSKLEGFELNLKSTKPITLKFKDAKIKEVFNIITKLSGINFIFDDAVKDTNFSIYLENGTFYQALDVITELNKLEKKILNESNVIIYPKNPEKKKQYEELYLQTFYLNKIDAKKAINLLRTMMQIKKIYVNEEMNAIVIRDTPDVIALAGKILEANDIPDAEVVLEVEVIELSKKNAENLGFLLSRYAISAQGFNNGTAFTDNLSTTTSTTTTTTPATPSNLLQLLQYKQFGAFLTVPNATYNFGKTLSNGETLSNPKMRIKNKEKAKFNVGTRVPITTTSSPTGGGVSVNVQYVDVGVKLNAEPTIQLNNEISIKLGMEVSSILSRDTVGGTGSATTVVTIGTRNLDTVLSLKDGETSIIGGLIQDTKNKSKQKISFIGEIPILGSIFSSHDDSNDKTELILAITPRIIRSLAVPEPAVAAFWSGKEDEPSTIKNYSSFNQETETAPSAAEPAASLPLTGAPGVSRPFGEAPAVAPVPTTPDNRRRRRPSAEAAPPATAALAQPPTAAGVSPQADVPASPVSSPPAVQSQPPAATPAPPPDAVPVSPAPSVAQPVPAVQPQPPPITPAPPPVAVPVSPAPSVVQPVPAVQLQPPTTAPAPPPVAVPVSPAPSVVQPVPAVQPQPPTTAPVPPPVAVPVSPAPPAPAIPVQPQAAAPAPPQVTLPAKTAPVSVPPVPAAQVQPPLPGTENLTEKKVVLKLAAPKTVKVNDEFKVDVVVSDVTNIYNGMFVLQYNPALLEFAGAEEGGFMKSDGKPTSFQHTFNREKGRVNINLYRVGNVGGASGSGTLAVLTFRATAKGSAKLDLSNAYILVPGGSKPLTADVFSTATEVQ